MTVINLRGPSWSWSFGSWIYNYLYNQFLLPLSCEFESDTGEVWSIQHHNPSLPNLTKTGLTVQDLNLITQTVFTL